MKFRIYTLIAVTSFVSVNLFLSQAQAEKPYGTGGCGLGSVIMGKDGNQVLAITTNETGTQTFAITSGTSNCVDHGIVKKRRAARAFIEVNHRQLANDIAKGGGESVSSLARLYDCSDDLALGHALKRDFKKIFPEASPSVDHIENAINDTIRTDQAGACLG